MARCSVGGTVRQKCMASQSAFDRPSADIQDCRVAIRPGWAPAHAAATVRLAGCRCAPCPPAPLPHFRGRCCRCQSCCCCCRCRHYCCFHQSRCSCRHCCCCHQRWKMRCRRTRMMSMTWCCPAVAVWNDLQSQLQSVMRCGTSAACCAGKCAMQATCSMLNRAVLIGERALQAATQQCQSPSCKPLNLPPCSAMRLDWLPAASGRAAASVHSASSSNAMLHQPSRTIYVKLAGPLLVPQGLLSLARRQNAVSLACCLIAMLGSVR